MAFSNWKEQILYPSIHYGGLSAFNSGSKEGAEDKLKGPTQKAGILQKGRFSVTSDDADEVLLLKCSLFLWSLSW